VLPVAAYMSWNGDRIEGKGIKRGLTSSRQERPGLFSCTNCAAAFNWFLSFYGRLRTNTRPGQIHRRRSSPSGFVGRFRHHTGRTVARTRGGARQSGVNGRKQRKGRRILQCGNIRWCQGQHFTAGTNGTLSGAGEHQRREHPTLKPTNACKASGLLCVVPFRDGHSCV